MDGLSFWSILKHFGTDLKQFEVSPEKGGGRSGREFDRPFGASPVLLSACNRWHRDRLQEGFIEVWSGENSGRRPASSSPEKTTRVRHTRWLHAQAREGPILGA